MTREGERRDVVSKENEKPQEHSESASTGLLDDYFVSCYKCATTENLQMLAHRNEYNNMVGWLFSCWRCEEEIKGKHIKVEIV